MGSKTNAFENSLLLLIFNNTAVANIGDANGLQPSATAGSLYVSLGTSATVADDATAATECAYTGYARVAVARTSGGWTVTNNVASNTAVVTFGKCTGNGPETVRYSEIWTAATSGTRLYWGQLGSDMVIDNNITPNFPAGTITITAD